MNRERFRALAAAYGGTVSRWPVAERGAARWFAFCHHRTSRDILRKARRLDRILQHSTSLNLGMEFRASLIQGAPCIHKANGKRRTWFCAIVGAGLAAACTAGIVAGFAIAPLTTWPLASPTDPAEVAASALGNPTELGDG